MQIKIWQMEIYPESGKVVTLVYKNKNTNWPKKRQYFFPQCGTAQIPPTFSNICVCKFKRDLEIPIKHCGACDMWKKNVLSFFNPSNKCYFDY